MGSDPSDFCFRQIHIDAARNATDDFNPFHDPWKWDHIRGNPFGMPIVLGFQLEALVEHRVTLLRESSGERALIDRHRLDYANFQFTFADVVLPGEPLHIDIKKTVNRIAEAGQIGNRVLMKKATGLVMLGFQRDSVTPLCMPEADLSRSGDLDSAPDRSWVLSGRYFMKRKFMSTGHAKNFLAGSLVDQHHYFDELEERVRFPAMFPAALTSCALLEKARQENYAFEANPLVYTSHFISVDRRQLERLKSNDRVHLLVSDPEAIPVGMGLGKPGFGQQLYRCFGLTPENRILFRAEVAVAALEDMLQSTAQKAPP